MSNIESYVHKGIPLEVIVKVKPEPYQKQDLRIFENKIALLDQYERCNKILIYLFSPSFYLN